MTTVVRVVMVCNVVIYARVVMMVMMVLGPPLHAAPTV